MAEKVTIMILKVDLECPCCYKKVKKILCKFPQIKDQVFNEKTNTVTIKVVCCSPEKIRDKLCCKGSKVIKSIEIVEPKPAEKPKDPEKPDKKVTFIETPKEPEKHKEKPAPSPPKPPAPSPPKPPAPSPPQPEPIMGPGPYQPYGYIPVYPARTCCGQCAEGYGGGPCYSGYGAPQQPCYDGHAYGYGHDRPCHVTRCDFYFTEENPQSCSIM